jgi:hypothetical protein
MALRDAEFDHATGKLGEEDYQALRAELSTEAMEAIRHEEGLSDPGGAAAEPEPERAEDGESRAGAEHLEDEIAAVRAGLKAGTTCTACGHVNRGGSNFCTTCGRPLSQPAAAPQGR